MTNKNNDDYLLNEELQVNLSQLQRWAIVWKFEQALFKFPSAIQSFVCEFSS
jgi:hypothetical protein